MLGQVREMHSEGLLQESTDEEVKQNQQEINPNEKGLDGRQDYHINRPSLASFSYSEGPWSPMFPVLMGLVEGIKTFYKE